jgi:hypothetical protein
MLKKFSKKVSRHKKFPKKGKLAAGSISITFGHVRKLVDAVIEKIPYGNVYKNNI